MEKVKVISAPPSLITGTRLLGTIGAAALGLTGEIETLVLVIYVVLFLLGLRIARQPSLVRWAGLAQPFFALLVFVIAVADFMYLSNSFLLAVAHFLLLIQGLRFLALQSVRDNIGSVMLSSMMILSACTLSVDWTFFAMVVLFLPTVIWTVIWANIFTEYQNLGAADNLDMRASSWRRAVPATRKATFLAFCSAVFTCALVFIMFPRLNLQGFRGQYLQPVRKTGFSNQVDLKSSGRIIEDNSIVMRVEIDPKDKPKWKGYLRGAALESFTGQQWRKANFKTERHFRNSRTGISLPTRRVSRGNMMRQSIYLESVDTTLLFAAPWPIWIGIDQAYVDRGDDFSVSRRVGNTWRLHYTVDSYQSQEDAFNTQRPSELPATFYEIKGIDLVRLEQLRRQIVGTETNPLKAAKKIEAFLRKEYGYTLDLGNKIDGNPIEIFLYQRKKGHCEYFAAAMCLLLRQNKIPSRMVTGFMAHEWNNRGGYFIVRMKDAHAWVEAYIAPHGWVQFDPTPRSYGSSNASEWMQKFAEAVDYLNLQWNRQILSYDFERQVGLVRGITSRSQAISLRFGGFGRSSRSFSSWKFGVSDFWKGFLVVVLLVTLFFMIEKTRAKERNRVWFYRAFLRALEKKGGPKPSFKTVAEFAAGLKFADQKKSEAAAYLTGEYYRQRFGPTETPSPENKPEIDAALAQLKQ